MDEYYRDLADAQRALEFLQEALDLLQGHTFSDLVTVKDQIVPLDENLRLLRSFLKWIQETSGDHEELLQPLVKQIRNAAAELLDAANSCTGDVLDEKMRNSSPLALPSGKQDFQSKIKRLLDCSLRINAFVKVIKSTGCEIKGAVLTENGSSSNDVRELGNSSSYNFSEESDSRSLVGDRMVGFNDDTLALLNRLTGNVMQLEVISITGMAGIGKTTLARTLYNDQSVVYCFHIRGWVSVSQAYHKHKVLSSILSSITGQKDSYCITDEEDVEQKLYKCLKGNRYMIVFDDIWDIGLWNDIKMCFPNDGNGSRILITTRITDVASNAGNSPPYCLRFLSLEESWDLFTHKVFADKSCPRELIKIGEKIVAKCKGLPLAIVVVAGLLKKEKTHEMWSHVAQTIGPLIDSNAEQIMDILALSYEHLAQDLKLCFLYLGTFPEDHEIPVKKLIAQWIAEGYIKHNEEKRLEDLAEDYLMELVNRSLLIVGKRGSSGGTKTCYIHDMLRELCIRKAREEKRSIATSADQQTPFRFDFLRVLDLGNITFDEFPKKILKLVHLKYLALQVENINSLPRRLYLLWNLETFILHVAKGRRITVPYEIWKMEKLRHMETSGALVFEHEQRASSYGKLECSPSQTLSSETPRTKCASPPILDNLQIISQICPSGSIVKILERTPNLRKLGLHLTLSKEKGWFSFPDLANLELLESLKFECQTLGIMSINIPLSNNFPPSLRKLTLIGSHVSWEQMSIIGMLPNLEVLKIKDNFFSGPTWETSEDGFRSLRFLKLSHVDLQQWITFESHFPNLEQLVLNACLDLEEIPSAIGEIYALQVIKVYRSSSSVADSAFEIQEFQRSIGNDEFKVFIYPHFEENISSVRA